MPEIARLGRTPRTQKEVFLAYFDTSDDTSVTNDGTEVTNGHIELHRRITRVLSNCENYSPRPLFPGRGLNL